MPLTTKTGDVNSTVFDVTDLPNAVDHVGTPSAVDGRDLTESIADREVITPPVGAGSKTLDPVTGGPLPSLPAYDDAGASVVQLGLYSALAPATAVTANGEIAFNATVLALASGASGASTIVIAANDRDGRENHFVNAAVDDSFYFATPAGIYDIVLTGAPTATAETGYTEVTLTGTVTFTGTHVEAGETVNVGYVGEEVGLVPVVAPVFQSIGEYMFDGVTGNPAHGEFKMDHGLAAMSAGDNVGGAIVMNLYDADDDEQSQLVGLMAGMHVRLTFPDGGVMILQLGVDSALMNDDVILSGAADLTGQNAVYGDVTQVEVQV